MTGELPTLWRRVSPEVYYTSESIPTVGGKEIAALKACARRTPRKRCRLCAHPEPGTLQQEMIIVMHRDSYVCPHRHIGKSESLTVLEGEADAVVFDAEGAVTQLIALGGPGGAGAHSVFYRMTEQVFHTLIFRSEWFVFVETTKGPFDAAKTERALWAPDEDDADRARVYLLDLRSRIERLRDQRR